MVNTATVYVYLGIFAALIAAGVGFPIPEELPIVTAGAWVGHASEPVLPTMPDKLGCEFLFQPLAPFPANVPLFWLSPDGRYAMPAPPEPPLPLHWWIMLPICILGVVMSDGLLYGMGRFWGPRLFDKAWMQRLVPPPKRERIERNFHKYGVMVLLFARMLPAIRSPIFIMAGIMRLPLTRFLMADGLYAIPGVSLLFFLAYWFGDTFRTLVQNAERRINSAKPILILLALSAVAAYLVYHFYRRPVATGEPKDLPMIGEQVAKLKCPDDKQPTLEQGKWTCPDGTPPRLQTGAEQPAQTPEPGSQP